MGLIHVTTTLRARENARKKYVSEFLVDTGATDSLVPAKELRRAGIKPRGRMAYELANGQTVEYDFGLAEIEFMGEITSGRIIFGPDDAEPLLGVTALESVGILVDPANRTLKRMPAIPLKSAVRRQLRAACYFSPAPTTKRGHASPRNIRTASQVFSAIS